MNYSFLNFFKKYKFLPIFLIAIYWILTVATFYIRLGDIHFKSDVARDFLLYEEILDKKIVLIGPRASGLAGFFHGPLWMYLNFPAFLFGQGNPVVVGWYWVFLFLLMILIAFYVAKSLFDIQTAILFAILFGLQYATEVNAFINPHGVLLLLPLAILLGYNYLTQLKVKYLILFLFVAGGIFQFQLAIGLPLLILMTPLFSWKIIKNRKLLHFFSFLALLLPLSTYLIFDYRHDFAQIKAVLSQISNGQPMTLDLFRQMFYQRFELLTFGGINLFHDNFSRFNIIILGLMVYVLFVSNKIKSQVKNILWLLFYLFVGFWIVSMLFRGELLYHHWFPMSILPILFLSALYKNFDKKIVSTILCFVLVNLFLFHNQFLNVAKESIGKKFDSWQFQRQMTEDIIKNSPSEFGYLIYAPDLFAYGPKYSLRYMRKTNPEKQIYVYTKLPVTYLTIEPVPPKRTDLSPEYFRQTKYGIVSAPTTSWSYPNGYRVERYELKNDELQKPIESDVDTGMNFR